MRFLTKPGGSASTRIISWPISQPFGHTLFFEQCFSPLSPAGEERREKRPSEETAEGLSGHSWSTFCIQSVVSVSMGAALRRAAGVVWPRVPPGSWRLLGVLREIQTHRALGGPHASCRSARPSLVAVLPSGRPHHTPQWRVPGWSGCLGFAPRHLSQLRLACCSKLLCAPQPPPGRSSQDPPDFAGGGPEAKRVGGGWERATSFLSLEGAERRLGSADKLSCSDGKTTDGEKSFNGIKCYLLY